MDKLNNEVSGIGNISPAGTGGSIVTVCGAGGTQEVTGSGMVSPVTGSGGVNQKVSG